MINSSLCLWTVVSVLLCHSSLCDDAAMMKVLKKGLTDMGSLNWSDPNPCKWAHVECNSQKRVTRIQIGNQKLRGTLPPEVKNLHSLQRFEVMRNHLSGPLPSLTGLSSLEVLLLHTNDFSYLPSDLFSGLSSLQAVDLGYNPFSPWAIPPSLLDAPSLKNFSANSANVVGPIPAFLGGDKFPALSVLHLSFNSLEGGLPSSFAGSSLQSLWLNSFKPNSSLHGSIGVLREMTMLTEVWLHGNHFTGPLPDLTPVTHLWSLNLRDNDFTGVVPASLLHMQFLRVVNLTNNHLQGSPPKFNTNVVEVDMTDDRNSFCVNEPGAPCDPRVRVLLSIAEALNYPYFLAENWKGNDPCNGWSGITCSRGDIIVISFRQMGLTGTISPRFSDLKSLQTLILSDNLLNGAIPAELVTLPNLKRFDVSNNNLDSDVPHFQPNVDVILDGNKLIRKHPIDDTRPGSRHDTFKPLHVGGSGNGKRTYTIGIVGGSVGCAVFLGLIGVAGVCLYARRRRRHSCVVQCPDVLVKQPVHSEVHDAVKITVAASRVNGVASNTYGYASTGLSDLHVVDHTVISMDLLRNVTDNFSDDNVLGTGGFGTVYKGRLHEGETIAVKRIKSGIISETVLAGFKSEIDVLSKVRHRHLVSFLGYILHEDERLLVYEYMPQGTLKRRLFDWEEQNLKPLDWMSRLVIALDVVRGVEYLHGLTHQTFIHRDLKSSNILLDDDMRAKVADFGLVRPVPDGTSTSYTKIAGTFGYLAPEYAETGKINTKVDVFSFGVILMEMITGKKAVNNTLPAVDSFLLVRWFHNKMNMKESVEALTDPTIELDAETISGISRVCEVAEQCCAKQSTERPEMSQVVNVLSSLVELWKPGETDGEHGLGDVPLLHNRFHEWQLEDEDTTVSIPL